MRFNPISAFRCSCVTAVCSLLFGCSTALPPVQIPTDAKFVSFASLDKKMQLSGLFWNAKDRNAPTAILLHGSNGAWRYQFYDDGRSLGRLTPILNTYKMWLTAEGYNVLVLDSLRPRGIRELSSRGSRSLFPDDRAKDVWAAMDWLKTSGYNEKVVLVGFSNGAATVLNAIDANQKHPKIAAGVAFYPRCAPYTGESDWVARTIPHFSVGSPLLVLVGNQDTSTPPGPCRKLINNLKKDGADADIVVYEGIGHGFGSISINAWRTPVGQDAMNRVLGFLASCVKN